jgi:3-hydroxyisobutyrate dehydrogenase
MLREVFGQTGAASRVLETDGEDMQHRAHDCYFSATHAAKDSGIALALGQSVGLPLPLAETTLEQYRRLVGVGKGDMDKSAIAELTFIDRMGH